MMSLVTSNVIKFDFLLDHVWNDLRDILNITGVEPVRVQINFNDAINQVEVEFKNQNDAIRFVEVYLGSDDPADIGEYVGELA